MYSGIPKVEIQCLLFLQRVSLPVQILQKAEVKMKLEAQNVFLKEIYNEHKEEEAE